MAKIFQLTVFLNFVGIGILLGMAPIRVTNIRIIAMYSIYIVMYLLASLTILSDTTFLVPKL